MNFLNQVVLADAASGNAFGTYGMILIWVLVFAAMYFFILRPSSKKKKEEDRNSASDNIRPGCYRRCGWNCFKKRNT